MVSNEKMLQFILENNYYNASNLRTVCGKMIQIKYLGIANPDQGPDFIHSRVSVEDAEWAGNIELHVKTSDWKLHRHHVDKNYINVVLHIVWEHDTEDFFHSPVLVLSNFIKEDWHQAYLKKNIEGSNRPCKLSSSAIQYQSTFSWLHELGEKRLNRKTEHILEELKLVDGDWEEVAWRTIARNFGYRVNAEAFYKVACSVSYTLLKKLKHDSRLIESLLFGQAGLLENDFNDSYPNFLKFEYSRLKSLYGLNETKFPIHFLRMRPSNFPTIRLSQLSAFISIQQSIFELMENSSDLITFSSRIRFKAATYWDCHYMFDRLSKCSGKVMGVDFICNIILNSIIPLMNAYERSTDSGLFKDKVRNWLLAMPAEQNKKTLFLNNLIKVNNAFESQSILELVDNFCSYVRCVDCQIAKEIESLNQI